MKIVLLFSLVLFYGINIVFSEAEAQGGTFFAARNPTPIFTTIAPTYQWNPYPYFMYNEFNWGPLWFVRCDDAQCSQTTSTHINTPNNPAGIAPVLALARDGLPMFLFDLGYSSPGQPEGMYFVKCNDSACVSHSRQLLVAQNLGTFTPEESHIKSLALGSDGLPVIVYFSYADHYMHVLKCRDVSCSLLHDSIPDPRTYVGNTFNRITIGSDGLPVVAYDTLSTNPYGVSVAKCQNLNCSNVTINPIATSKYTLQMDIAIGTDGLPIVVHDNLQTGQSKVTKCGTMDCSSGNTTYDIANSALGMQPRVTIQTDGNPIIFYYNNTVPSPTAAHFFVQKCGDISCSTGNTVTILPLVPFVYGYNPTFVSRGETWMFYGSRGLNGICSNELVKCTNTTCSTFTHTTINSFSCGTGYSMEIDAIGEK